MDRLKPVCSLVFVLALAVVFPADVGGTTLDVDEGGVDPRVVLVAVPDPVADTEAVGLHPDAAPPIQSAVPLVLDEDFGSVKTVTHASGSALLRSLGPELRANAVVELEPFGSPGITEQLVAADVESKWNAGWFAEAIGDFEHLEALGGTYAVGIAWKQPIASTTEFVYPDVQVSSRTGGVDAALDYHPETNLIFALIVWEDTWTMNVSTNGGISWSETYLWNSTVANIADMAVIGDYAWIVYSGAPDGYGTARMRRCHAATGAADSGYNFEMIADEQPDTITEIVVVGPTPDFDNRVYVAYLVDEDDSIHFWWSLIAGTTFYDLSPDITDAEAGLDLAWNPYTETDYKRWISYVSTGDVVRLYRSSSSDWNIEANTAWSGFRRHTSLSAYADNIYCAYECETDPGEVGACHLINNSAGAGTWYWEKIYNPTTSSDNAKLPNMTARSGAGRALVFGVESGALDDVRYSTRRGWTTGPWSTPTWYNSHDHVSGDETYIEWIGSDCIGSFGMLYFADFGGGEKTPYFDLMTERGFFCDGFESGNTSAW